MSHWKTTEITLLREKFPRLGVDGCAKLMPTRSISAIQTKARDLGLKTEMRRANDLLVSVLKRLMVVVEENGDTKMAISDAKSVLREIRR